MGLNWSGVSWALLPLPQHPGSALSLQGPEPGPLPHQGRWPPRLPRGRQLLLVPGKEGGRGPPTRNPEDKRVWPRLLLGVKERPGQGRVLYPSRRQDRQLPLAPCARGAKPISRLAPAMPGCRPAPAPPSGCAEGGPPPPTAHDFPLSSAQATSQVPCLLGRMCPCSVLGTQPLTGPRQDAIC